MPKKAKANVYVSECCEEMQNEKNSSNDNSATTSNSNNEGRTLRKRKINLNRLASRASCPQVCEFQHCGIQLADGDTLEVCFFFLTTTQVKYVSTCVNLYFYVFLVALRRSLRRRTEKTGSYSCEKEPIGFSARPSKKETS